MHMIAHRPRNADASWRAFGLEPGSYVNGVPVQIGPIRNSVPDVDPYAKTNCSIRGLVAVQGRHLLLHLRSATHCPIYAIEQIENEIKI